MRRSGIILFLLGLVVLWLVLVLGLSGGTAPAVEKTPAAVVQTGRQNTGLRVIADPAASGTITFAIAARRVEDFFSGADGIPSNHTIHYIRGMDLDRDGQASRWVFGAFFNGQNVMVSCDPSGIRSIPWEGGLPAMEIDTAKVLAPETIIRQNAGEIFGTSAGEPVFIPQIELSEGTYTIRTGQAGQQRIHIFDSTTGALIYSYA